MCRAHSARKVVPSPFLAGRCGDKAKTGGFLQRGRDLGDKFQARMRCHVAWLSVPQLEAVPLLPGGALNGATMLPMREQAVVEPGMWPFLGLVAQDLRACGGGGIQFAQVGQGTKEREAGGTRRCLVSCLHEGPALERRRQSAGPAARPPSSGSFP